MMSLVRAQLGEPQRKSVIKPKMACLLAFCFVFVFVRSVEECARCCGLLQCCYKFQGISRHFKVLTVQKNSPRLISGAFVVLCELFNGIIECVKLLNNVMVDVGFVFCVSHKCDDVFLPCSCR